MRDNEISQKYDSKVIKHIKNEDITLLMSEQGTIEFNPEILQNKVDSLVITITKPENVIAALKSELN